MGNDHKWWIVQICNEIQQFHAGTEENQYTHNQDSQQTDLVGTSQYTSTS